MRLHLRGQPRSDYSNLVKASAFAGTTSSFRRDFPGRRDRPADGVFGGADILVCFESASAGLVPAERIRIDEWRTRMSSTHQFDGRQECLPHHSLRQFQKFRRTPLFTDRLRSRLFPPQIGRCHVNAAQGDRQRGRNKPNHQHDRQCSEQIREIDRPCFMQHGGQNS